MAFIAKYRSECYECPGIIEPGDGAAYNLEGDICHEVCPAVVPVKAKASCPHCWTELPATGKCDCRD